MGIEEGHSEMRTMILDKRHNSTTRKLWTSLVAAIAIGIVGQGPAMAQSGVWSDASGDGAWSNSAKWQGGTIANGADNTADFSQVDVDAAAVLAAFPGFARNAIQLDGARTIGNMIFGDSNTATPGGWEVYVAGVAADYNNPANTITLAGATPTITVNPLGPINSGTLGDPSPENIDDAIIRSNLAGTAGFTKAGNGTLTIAGPGINHDMDGGTTPIRPQDLTGTVNVNAGTLRVGAGALLDFEAVNTPAQLSFNVASGAILQSANTTTIRNITAANGAIFEIPAGTLAGGGFGTNQPAGVGNNGIAIAPGGTITINHNATTSQFFGNIGGTGSTVNFNMVGTAGLVTSLDRDWALGGAPAVVNFKGTTVGTQAQVRMRINGGSFGGFGAVPITLDNTLLFTNTNSGGNPLALGSLTGNATSTLQGGAAGTVVSYQIGGLNTDTVFAGNVTTGNGINIFKVGTGTLELSGTLSYQPRADVNLPRRGGITRVEAGTLKLTGPAAIMGGIDDTGTATNGGLLYSTIDVRANATLDVSGTASPYSTAAIQQVIGAGIIKGNYNHDEGILAPGDTVTGGNTASLIATAGTLNFSDTLSFAGTGQINFDISPNLVTGNDRIQVNGANLAGSPSLKIGFLGGASAGQYVVVNSTTPLVGTTAGWTVQWEGRGAAPSLIQTANQVKLDLGTITSGNLNWRGNVDSNWNAGAAAGTANWHNTGTNASDKFFQLDNVAFRDTYDGVNAVSNTTVNMTGTMSPMSVVVDSSLNYTIGGTGRITGGTSLTKQGTGTLTITTANDYTGGTTISGGIVNRDAAGSFGTGSITLSNAELQSRAWTSPNAINVPTSTTAKIRTLGGVVAAPTNPDDAAVVNINVDGAISGSGGLELHNDTLTTPDPLVPGARAQQVQAMDFRANNSGFTGSVSFKGASPIVLRLTVAGAEGTNAAWDLGSNGSSVGVLFGVATPTTVKLGALSGGAASPSGAVTRLRGRISSGGVSPVVYEIGGLNTDTTFAGNITSGQLDGTPARPENTTSLTKVGTGKLTLSGMDSALETAANYTLYQGDTRVQGGTLSIQRAYLADAADVFVADGAIFDLNFGAIADTIDSLYLGGTPVAPGTYGSLASAATNKSNFFTGVGMLQVTTLGAAIGFTGDYNNDGRVDAADYTVWRDNLGAPGTALQHRDPANMGVVGDADYASWKANFGMGAGAGSGSLAQVPEPTSVVLVMMALGMFAAAGSRRRS
jgi:autotransporter-associated beta strand protein